MLTSIISSVYSTPHNLDSDSGIVLLLHATAAGAHISSQAGERSKNARTTGR